jgi:hypothetical protein
LLETWYEVLKYFGKISQRYTKIMLEFGGRKMMLGTGAEHVTTGSDAEHLTTRLQRLE